MNQLIRFKQICTKRGFRKLRYQDDGAKTSSDYESSNDELKCSYKKINKL